MDDKAEDEAGRQICPCQARRAQAESLIISSQDERAKRSSSNIPISSSSHDSTSSNMKRARPYRSHKYPACTRCHKRRSRCTIDSPGQPCLLCRTSGVVCSAEHIKPSERLRPKFGSTRQFPINAEGEYTSHIIGPIIARDTQIVEAFAPGVGSIAPDKYSGVQTANISKTPDKPAYHTPVASRRPSPPSCRCSRRLPEEFLQQIRPHLEHLLTLYFEELHPCFPILDEQSIRTRLGRHDNDSSTFALNLIAYAVFYWRLSPRLCGRPGPDQDRVWQIAVTAMNADSQKGDLFSIAAAALNIAGRPSKGVIHNITNVARITALAHSTGLNHDCQDWNLDQSVKDVRTKLWWAVLIHDRWFNFAQGTPPSINKGHYDVSVPTLLMLSGSPVNSSKHVKAAECYVQLCRLTEIVGDVLPILYHIRSGNDGLAAKQISKSGIELEDWATSLPSWLDLDVTIPRPAIPGLANLHLSQLAVRMLLRRIAWHEDIQQRGSANTSLLLECLTATESMTCFVLSLRTDELAGFWLPYNVHHFTSAVTLSLRCALQTDSSRLRSRSMAAARQLVDHLKVLQDEHRWDMADIAFSSGESILRRVEESLRMHPPTSDKTSNQLSSSSTILQQETGVGIWNDKYQEQAGSGAGTESTVEAGSGSGQQETIEELFPELFSEFIDSAFFDQGLQSPPSCV